MHLKAHYTTEVIFTLLKIQVMLPKTCH